MYIWVTLNEVIRLFKAPPTHELWRGQTEKTWKVGWEMRGKICSYLIVNMYKNLKKYRNKNFSHNI